MCKKEQITFDINTKIQCTPTFFSVSHDLYIDPIDRLMHCSLSPYVSQSHPSRHHGSIVLLWLSQQHTNRRSLHPAAMFSDTLDNNNSFDYCASEKRVQSACYRSERKYIGKLHDHKIKQKRLTFLGFNRV